MIKEKQNREHNPMLKLKKQNKRHRKWEMKNTQKGCKGYIGLDQNRIFIQTQQSPNNRNKVLTNYSILCSGMYYVTNNREMVEDLNKMRKPK